MFRTFGIICWGSIRICLIGNTSYLLTICFQIRIVTLSALSTGSIIFNAISN